MGDNIVLRCVHSDVTELNLNQSELNSHSLVFDKLTNRQAQRAHWSLTT